MDAINEMLAKLAVDIAAEEQRFLDLRHRYELEACIESHEDEKRLSEKIDEAYGRMVLATAPMREMREYTIKRLAEVEAFKPPKPITINALPLHPRDS